MFPGEITALAEIVLSKARTNAVHLACAESCTGGLVAAALTEIPGSSEVFECGFVTYTNRAKQALLGVDDVLLTQFGAVSVEVAEAMACGALVNSEGQMAVSVTGIAGPDGGSVAKPVGLVCFALAVKCTGGPPTTVSKRITFPDEGRTAIRLNAVRFALSLFDQSLD